MYSPKTSLRHILILSLIQAGLLFSQISTYDAFPENSYPEISKEILKKIEDALPEKSSVKVDEPRKILVFTLHIRDGEVLRGHPSIPYANTMLKMMGEKTGAYEIVVSKDTMMFKPENLKQFDAVCFNNTAGVLINNPELRNSFLDYVYSGGGFIGIHAAGATFVQWPEYGQFPEFGHLLGGYENSGHPWKPHEFITLKIDEPDHPVNAVFDGEGFKIRDEVFQFQSPPYTRDKLRVLVTIDTGKTDMSQERRILPERRADGDLAMSWVKNYGRGRVFYSTFGHNDHINWNAKIVKHYLDGIQFALGDLDGPIAPSNKATEAVRAQEELGWKIAVQCWSFNRFSFLEAADKAAELGLMYLEAYPGQRLGADYPDEVFDHNMSRNRAREIRQILDRKGLRVINYGVCGLPNDEAECRKVFEFARFMGIETIASEPPEEAFDLIEKLADEYNINVAVHNHPNPSHYWNPETVLKVTKGRSKRIGACGDTGHWPRSSIKPVDAIADLKGRMISLHLKDLSEFGNLDAHDVPWGTGQSGFMDILSALKEQDFKGVFSIEYEYNWDNNVPEIAQCIDAFNKACIQLVK
ncbi:ThuA domain-containing protein [candidate division KSB1 bacterium]|nr:ThuA domain-containing protein [candidate division KSB1 bacterium]